MKYKEGDYKNILIFLKETGFIVSQIKNMLKIKKKIIPIIQR